MAVKIITPPVSEIFTLSEAKLFLRITGSEEDSLVNLFIKSARETLERETRRSLAPKTLEATFHYFSCSSVIKLEKSPITSVTSIKYIDTSGSEVTLSSDVYSVDTESTPGRIVLNEGQSWPQTKNIPNAVRIRYEAGYAADKLPSDLKVALYWLINHYYNNRDIVLTGPMANTAELPIGLDRIILPYIVRGLDA